jgi:mono/diheme cytochrome c family protein
VISRVRVIISDGDLHHLATIWKKQSFIQATGLSGPVQERMSVMTGDRWSIVVLGVMTLCVACGSGRETGTQSSTRDTTAPLTDTAASLATRPDTASAPQATTADTARSAAKPTPAREPPPKPVPVRKPPKTLRPARADTATAAPAPAESAQANPAAAASTPPSDPYHQAPRDTVTAEVYEGWKQYNLNCARCHGEDVLGTTIAPHLIVSVRPGGTVDTKEKFIQTVCAGRPEKGMPSWCALGMEMEKINAMYSYVKGRSEGKMAPGRPARRE